MNRRWAEISPDAIYEELPNGNKVRVRFIGTDVEVAEFGSKWEIISAFKMSPVRFLAIAEAFGERS